MSDEIVWAQEFYTISKIREIMLLNSFSHLPCYLDSKLYLISDASVAEIWNKDRDAEERDKMLYSLELGELFSRQEVRLEQEVEVVHQDAEIAKVLKKLSFKPVLVSEGKDKKKIVGIVTAFDYL